MSGHLAVTPSKVSGSGFADHSAHRQSLPPIYNQYAAMTEALGFLPRQDNHQVVYRPLFTTAFVLDDFFADNGCFGAEQIILGSASSKTALATALLLQDRPPRLIGLTSQANRAFVEGVSLYDTVRTYAEVAALDASVPTAYIDMSGNRAVLAAVHHHFGDRLVSSCSVGITHWEARDGADPGTPPITLPGARPTLFFAPSQIQKRHKDWGTALFQQKLAGAWQDFLMVVDDWITIVEATTPDQLSETYLTVLHGAAPATAHVLKRQG
jgi:hypothetical protein